jgi:hypothetical protein
MRHEGRAFAVGQGCRLSSGGRFRCAPKKSAGHPSGDSAGMVTLRAWARQIAVRGGTLGLIVVD